MPKKPTIILFSAFYDPWMSGAERCVQEVVDRLSDRYHFVLLTSRLSRRVPARETRPFGEIRRLGIGHPIDKWLFCILAPFAALRIRARVAHAVMESYAGIALWVFGLLRPRVRRVLTLQSGDLDSDKKQRRIPGWLWRRIHTSPDRVTAISGFLATRAVRLGADPARVSVIANGVDLSRITPQRPEERVRHRIVCIARLAWEKGLGDLLAALALTRKTIPDAHVVLVGDGADRAALEARAKELGITTAVTFRGALPNAEALAVLRTADVFACPSLAEGLGIVFIEAQACGVPPVGTNVGGIPDVIADGESGLLVPANDPDRLAAALTRVLSDEPLRARLVVGSLASAARFDWQKIMPRYAEMYQELNAPRVLLAASIYPPDIGGPARVAAQTVADLSQRGLAVSVVARGPRQVSALLIRTPSRIGYALAVFRLARHADVVYVQDASLTGWLALNAARAAGAKVVTRLGGDLLWERALDRGAPPQPLRTYYASGAWKKAPLLFRFFLRQILRRSALLIFNGPFLPGLYAEAGFRLAPQKIVFNPAPAKRQADPPTERRIILPGRLTAIKNQEGFLDAAEDAVRNGAALSVLLIGDGPYKQRFEAWKNAHHADWLTIRSSVPSAEIASIMGNTCAVALPSWCEVGPNTALEALSQGTPVLLTRENGYREALAPFVREIDPADRASMRDAIIAILSPDGQREARRRAEAFHWPQSYASMGDEIAAALRDVCAS